MCLVFVKITEAAFNLELREEWGDAVKGKRKRRKQKYINDSRRNLVLDWTMLCFNFFISLTFSYCIVESKEVLLKI